MNPGAGGGVWTRRPMSRVVMVVISASMKGHTAARAPRRRIARLANPPTTPSVTVSPGYLFRVASVWISLSIRRHARAKHESLVAASQTPTLSPDSLS
jgi:hypothetical protein